MTPIKDMPCWEIMQCSGTENCPARTHPDVPCWEIAEKLGTSQSVMNICSDCIVYVVKTNDPILTRNELVEIMSHRNIGGFSKECPAYDSRGEKVNLQQQTIPPSGQN